jgi:hypothetical protein
MARGGSGARTTWKDRLDRTGWVDDGDWLDADGRPESAESIEFLESEPSAYRLSSGPDRAQPSVLSSVPARLVGLGAVAVVLLTLGLLAQPGDDDPFSQLSPVDQQEILQRQGQAGDALPLAELSNDEVVGADSEPDGDASEAAAEVGPELADSGTESADAADLRPGGDAFGDIAQELEELPGVLYLGIGGGAAVLAITAEDGVVSHQRNPDETEPELAYRLTFFGETLVAEPGPAQALGYELLIGAEEVVPSDNPGSLVVDVAVVGDGLDVLGRWGDDMVVHKAGRVWALGSDGSARDVAAGQLLGFDGRHLAMVVCDEPRQCRITVGPPNQPERRSVPVPARLADQPLDRWTHAVAISGDGGRVALIDRRTFNFPIWVDMETGEHRQVLERVEAQAEIAWSPDGRWLSYTLVDGDLLLWDTEVDQSWWVTIGRDITDLLWMP